MKKERKLIYVEHPVSLEKKKELVGKGYRILDAAFKPAGHVDDEAEESRPAASVSTGPATLDDLDKDQLHALAKERGVNVHHLAGADKVREALREAEQAKA